MEIINKPITEFTQVVKVDGLEYVRTISTYGAAFNVRWKRNFDYKPSYHGKIKDDIQLEELYHQIILKQLETNTDEEIYVNNNQ